MDYYSLTDPGCKAELADPQRTVYSQSGHLSVKDQTQGQESPPAKDQHPNH